MHWWQDLQLTSILRGNLYGRRLDWPGDAAGEAGTAAAAAFAAFLRADFSFWTALTSLRRRFSSASVRAVRPAFECCRRRLARGCLCTPVCEGEEGRAKLIKRNPPHSTARDWRCRVVATRRARNAERTSL